MGRKKVVGIAAGIVVALLGVGAWWRRHPSACPYGLRLLLDAPHPFLTRSGLKEILAPEPGERVLEVGPGTGYYSLEVARWISPHGTLDVLDIQQKMLDLTVRRARERGISNVAPRRGDAQRLPYPDDAFDAAYLNFVLGEVPDGDAALRELRRVLKPGGRLVVGEALPDPHMVPFESLRRRAEAGGLRFERRRGGHAGYYARFAA